MPEEGGTVTGMGVFIYGEEAILEATPAEHYTFVNWTEDGQVVSNASSYAFVVTRDRHLVAHFAQTYYSIQVTTEPEQGGAVQGGGNYVYGQTAHLTAIPNDNYGFVEWTENGVVLSQEPEMSFVVTRSRNLVARFGYYDGMNERAETLSTFPNPTTGLVVVKGLTEGYVIQVFDGNMGHVATQKCEGDEAVIDLGGLPDGCYYLVVLSPGGRRLIKLVKAQK